jgi:CBS-domain-containing membrane protein
VLVRDVMTAEIVSVTPQTPVKRAIQLMHAHQITAMPVLDGQDGLVGVVSEADVIRGSMIPDRRAHEIPVRVERSSLPATVGDVMTPHPVTIRSDQDLAAAVELLADTQVKSLPVVDDGHMAGMLSRRDLIAVLARGDEVIGAEVEGLLRDGDVPCRVEVVDGVVELTGQSDVHARDIARVLAASVPGVVGVGFAD